MKKSSYVAMIMGAIGGIFFAIVYKKIKDKFVATFLTPDGTSTQNKENSETSDYPANE